MPNVEQQLITELLDVLPGVDVAGLEVVGSGGLPGLFPVSELATASVSVAALAAASVAGASRVTVDRALASAWFGMTLAPIGWELPSPWDPIAGDYRCRDGWIRLHTNAPHHRAVALSVLGTPADRDAVAAAVAEWNGDELENAVVAAGGCAAVMRSSDEWAGSAQGLAGSLEPLIAWVDTGLAGGISAGAAAGLASAERSLPGHTTPLTGVRVLDLTRVLAGPIATRFLGMLGADVLRIDPPEWDETIAPEVTLAKRTTRLDLRSLAGRAVFEELVRGADVLVHGYRSGALESLGYGTAELQQLRPGLIDVALNAYGWSGPLDTRRGFDSLVQMTTGIAHAGMLHAGAERPVPLPVQALDQATGYLMAAAVLSALRRRLSTGVGHSARLSLARTAQLLLDRPGAGDHTPFEGAVDVAAEDTAWGPATRVRAPFQIDGVTLGGRGAVPFGADVAEWL